MIELLFPELLPPTSLLSVTNKQIPHLPTSRTKGLNLSAPKDGAALESEERKKKQENDQSTRAVKRPLDQFCSFVCLFVFAGCRTGLGHEDLRVCVCVFKYIRFHRRAGGGAGGQGPNMPFPRAGLSHPRGQESCWRAEPTQTREGRG